MSYSGYLNQLMRAVLTPLLQCWSQERTASSGALHVITVRYLGYRLGLLVLIYVYWDLKVLVSEVHFGSDISSESFIGWLMDWVMLNCDHRSKFYFPNLLFNCFKRILVFEVDAFKIDWWWDLKLPVSVIKLSLPLDLSALTEVNTINAKDLNLVYRTIICDKGLVYTP